MEIILLLHRFITNTIIIIDGVQIKFSSSMVVIYDQTTSKGFYKERNPTEASQAWIGSVHG